MTVKRRKVIAQQYHQDEHGHKRSKPRLTLRGLHHDVTHDIVMDPPAKRRIKRQPPDRVRAFLADPDPVLWSHRMAEMADEVLA